MCEVVEGQKLFPLHSLSYFWRKIKPLNYFKIVFFSLGWSIFNVILILLDYLVTYLKGMSKGMIKKVDAGCQTNVCYQDITELVTHHFGLLHESHYVNRILHTNQWNKLNTEICSIKKYIKQNSDSQEKSIGILKEEMSQITSLIQAVSRKIDHSVFVSPSVSKANIPPPPPLPPSDFALGTPTCSRKMSANKNRIFTGTCPPRPVITVESLKQVKLKKIPIQKDLKENKSIDKCNLDWEPHSSKPNKSGCFPKRPNTTECSKPQANVSKRMSPRSLSSNRV